MPLPSFSSLISLAITYNIVLKRNGENKHLYLVTNHREKAFLLPQLVCCYLWVFLFVCLFFCQWPLLDWGCSFLFLFCIVFYYRETMDFVKYFSCIYWNYHTVILLLLRLLLSRFSRVRLCATPQMEAHQAPPSLGFSRQEHWSGLPFPSPMHESEKWKGSCSVMSDS